MSDRGPGKSSDFAVFLREIYKDIIFVFHHVFHHKDTPRRRDISTRINTMVRDAAMRASRPCLGMRRPRPFPNFIPRWHRPRLYSIQSQEEKIAQLPDINPGALSITRTTTPKQILPSEELVFGRTFTGKHATAFLDPTPHFVLRQVNLQIICSQ